MKRLLQGKLPVRSETQVQVLPLQQPVHEGEHLDYQLVLSQVVAAFVDDDVAALLGRRICRRLRVCQGNTAGVRSARREGRPAWLRSAIWACAALQTKCGYGREAWQSHDLGCLKTIDSI